MIKIWKWSLFVPSESKYKTSMGQGLVPWTLEGEPTILFPISIFWSWSFFCMSYCVKCVWWVICLQARKYSTYNATFALKICISIYDRKGRGLDSHFRSYLYIGFPVMQLCCMQKRGKSSQNRDTTASINASVIFFTILFNVIPVCVSSNEGWLQ